MTISPFIFGIAGLELSEREIQAFKAHPPFGIILFVRNIDNKDQLRRLILEIKSVTFGQSLIFIDQEGGRVQRLVPPYWQQYPNISQYEHLDDTQYQKAIYAHFRLIGEELHEAGIDANCAPCLDLRVMNTAMFLKDRTFSHNPKKLIGAGRIAIEALSDAGILPVIKHLPGHGRAMVDSHLTLPHVEFPSDPYKKPFPADIEIFQNFNHSPMAMTAHILYKQIDKENPCTLSAKSIDFIRKIIGYEGILMTDDIAMKALHGTPAKLSQKAFAAGVDIVLHCSGEFDEIQSIMELEIQSSQRVLNAHKEFLHKRKHHQSTLTLSYYDQLQADILRGNA